MKLTTWAVVIKEFNICGKGLIDDGTFTGKIETRKSCVNWSQYCGMWNVESFM